MDRSKTWVGIDCESCDHVWGIRTCEGDRPVPGWARGPISEIECWGEFLDWGGQ